MGYHPNNLSHMSTTWDNEEYITNTVLETIKKRTKRDFGLKRAYSSLQNHSEYGLWHIDDEEKDNYTLTIYLGITKNLVDLNEKEENDAFGRNSIWLNMLCAANIDKNFCNNGRMYNENNNVWFSTEKKFFEKEIYNSYYSKENYLPLELSDSENEKEKKIKKINETLKVARESDIGGGFRIFSKRKIVSCPFLENRACFFRGSVRHTGDNFESKMSTNYYRIVVSFKIYEKFPGSEPVVLPIGTQLTNN